MSRSRFFRRAYAWPSEHGSWVWWIGPFAVGLAAGGSPGGDTAALFTAALAGFLLHHPATIAVKAATGRRPPADLRPALGWVLLYAAAAALAVPCLVVHGHARVLWLVIPGALVFAVHLTLVVRRTERRRVGVEILEAGVLALAAPAAYWVSGGDHPAEPWVLWGLTWLGTAAAIVNVYLRFALRAGPPTTDVARRAAVATPSVAAALAGLVGSAVLAVLRVAPPAAPLAFAILLADAADTALRPPVGVRPARVGMRALWVLSAHVVVLALAWLAV